MEEGSEDMGKGVCSWSSGKNTGSGHSCCKESWTDPNTKRTEGWPLV